VVFVYLVRLNFSKFRMILNKKVWIDEFTIVTGNYKFAHVLKLDIIQNT
jgi:hypothetical protein